MKTTFAYMTAATALAVGASGYDPYYPYAYSTNATAATFDRSWDAMLGAFADQGVSVVGQDRGSGMIDGRRGDISVRAHIAAQNDGRVRAEFNVNGASQDPGLPDRISRAYDMRMGR